ncbi:MAG: methylenetetrahydrofolate--tRNA-(uracil(54)-C(5))-methyltransferase (FADH(2)-oxidizing) TrmFO [Deltaproteobacteria bacterium]|nr:MAG: methylenetetrahydrofolate--tRNA-(uracil(54)-C(5))-methyltransferase (FADH(2)-oxidizing) TrmFO [Deltaproteobacteria bacterium]
MEIRVIGAGLAGSEAALVISAAGIPVRLYEMRPLKMTPAHKSDHFAELVCSNSLGSVKETDGKGLLKKELEIYGSNLLEIAKRMSVPAGKALAVDRWAFQTAVTEFIMRRRNVEIVREEVKRIEEDVPTVVATGPLTSDALATYLGEVLGEEHLFFYDAISPIVEADSLDFSKGFFANRYEEGGEDYLNFPMTEEEFDRFYEELVKADRVAPHPFEDERYFESCMPIEVLASRGRETLLFGPMRPVGLIDPRTGKRPFCVVQLRRENREGTMYNMVGFQTRLTYPEQKRVFRLIPGFENARFFRYGSIHRNTYLNSPSFLEPTLEWRGHEGIFFAGQLIGVEGYVESIASGLVAGINVVRRVTGENPLVFPDETMTGALLGYVSRGRGKDFQPMNANFGLLPLPSGRVRKSERRRLQARRALEKAREFRDLHFNFQPLCVI